MLKKIDAKKNQQDTNHEHKIRISDFCFMSEKVSLGNQEEGSFHPPVPTCDIFLKT